MPTLSWILAQSLPEDHPFLVLLNCQLHLFDVSRTLVMTSSLRLLTSQSPLASKREMRC